MIISLPGIAMSGARAVQDYLGARGPVLGRFPFPWFTPEGFRARQRYLAERWDGDRAGLAAALAAYNDRIGAGPAAVAGARRLAGADALAVVTGQQAGAATGPLYTIFKAITAVQLARQQEERLGVPVVPVFWVAAEDHDFAEIAPVCFPGPEGWQKITLGGAPAVRTSVGQIPMGPATAALLAEIEAALPATEFKPAVVELLRSTAEAATDLADWFARLMARLFAGSGLVFINPMDPAVRRLESPFFQMAISRFEEIDAALGAGLAAWQELGYEPTVERYLGSLNLFAYVDGERLPLAGAGAYCWVRGREEVGWSRDELMALAAASPERFSTNVVTRPAAQGFILPDLAYVAGPGEIQYFGLYREVFAALGRELPLVYPRTSVTLVEPPLARSLEKQKLELAQVFTGLEERKRQVLAEADRLGIDRLFAEFRAGFDERYGALLAAVIPLDPSLAFVAEENRRQIQRQFDRLEEKVRQAHRKNHEVALRQLDRLATHLYPQGKLQERTANIMYFLTKYGVDLVGRLLAELPLPLPWRHLGLYL